MNGIVQDGKKMQKKKELKILVFSSLPADSGCYLRAKYLASALLRNGAQARLISEPKGVSFMLHMLFSLFRNLWICFVTKFDVGISIKPYPNTLWPLLLKKMFRRNLVVVADIDDIDYGYRKGIIPIISCMLQLPFPKYCDIVTYHNDNLYGYIQDTFKVKKDRLYRLNQGVDFTVYGKVDRRKAAHLRKQMISRSGLIVSKLLVYSAHLNIASDLDEVMEAYKIVLAKRTDVHLIVAGGGPMLAYFKRMATQIGLDGKIFFTGHLSPDEVALYVSAADFALVYYKDKQVNYYRTSMKMRECLALGQRVICNDVGDLREFKKYCYMFSSGAKSFSEGIVKSLDQHSDNRARMGQSFVRKKYNWVNIGFCFADKLIGLF